MLLEGLKVIMQKICWHNAKYISILIEYKPDLKEISNVFKEAIHLCS